MTSIRSFSDLCYIRERLEDNSDWQRATWSKIQCFYDDHEKYFLNNHPVVPVLHSINPWDGRVCEASASSGVSVSLSSRSTSVILVDQ